MIIIDNGDDDEDSDGDDDHPANSRESHQIGSKLINSSFLWLKQHASLMLTFWFDTVYFISHYRYKHDQ